MLVCLGICFLLTASLLPLGCRPDRSSDSQTYTKQRIMFGTLVTIKVFEKDQAKAKKAVGKANVAMTAVQSQTNNYDPQSAISWLNWRAQYGLPAPLHPLLLDVVKSSLRGARATGGAFDPTVWPVTRLWGFGRRERLPSPAELRATLKLVGYGRVEWLGDGSVVYLPVRGMGLDLGGVAKGYAVAEAVRALTTAGIRHAMVTTGSTTAVFGGKPDGSPWKIGIENPRAPGKIVGVVSLKSGTVSTSGDYQNYFVRNGLRYHHILDPKTGMPARGTMSATVVGDIDATTSDILSTGLFVMGFEKAGGWLAGHPRLGIIFVTSDGRLRTAGNLKGRVTGLARSVWIRD